MGTYEAELERELDARDAELDAIDAYGDFMYELYYGSDY